MIPCSKTRAPKGFREKVAVPGNRWLRANPKSTGRPPAYWRKFRGRLARAFHHRCAYSAMYEPVGTVDHFLSIEGGHRRLAYAWSNYRYAAQWINSSKGTLDAQVLDPFVVKDGWFELELPSLQLVMTNKVPQGLRAQAQVALDRLHLGHGEEIIRQRAIWYDLYQKGQITLEGLDRVAPLLADAIRRKLAAPTSTTRKRTSKKVVV